MPQMRVDMGDPKMNNLALDQFKTEIARLMARPLIVTKYRHRGKLFTVINGRVNSENRKSKGPDGG